MWPKLWQLDARSSHDWLPGTYFVAIIVIIIIIVVIIVIIVTIVIIAASSSAITLDVIVPTPFVWWRYLDLWGLLDSAGGL